MRALIFFISFIIALPLLSGCGSDDENPALDGFTGQEVTYTLQKRSDFEISGTVTFREKVDGFTTISIQLTGTSGESLHPTHLHFGDITAIESPLAVGLNPLSAATGESETNINALADETPITYQELMEIKGHIKVHLSDSEEGKLTVLAGGNVGW